MQHGAQGTALRQSPSLPQVQHKDRSIGRARAHLVTARVPAHLHTVGYSKAWLVITWCLQSYYSLSRGQWFINSKHGRLCLTD